MRVSLGLQYKSMSGYLSDASEKMLDAQRVVTTGKKISRPSDDPTLANRSMSLRSGLNGIAQYKESVNLAKSVIDSSEATVGDIADQLQQLQQIATTGNSSLSTETQSALLAQIKDIRERMLSLSDTKYLNRYLFSGTATTTSPITQNVNTPAVPPYVYQGNTDPIQIRILSTETIQTNVTANQIFNLDGSAGSGVRDVFTIMDDLETAIKANDVDSTSSLLKDIDDNYQNVLGIQAELGARSSRLEANTTTLTESKDRMSELLSNLEDMDYSDAIVQLQTQQNVYQAALAVTAQVMQGKTLMDYL